MFQWAPLYWCEMCKCDDRRSVFSSLSVRNTFSVFLSNSGTAKRWYNKIDISDQKGNPSEIALVICPMSKDMKGYPQAKCNTTKTGLLIFFAYFTHSKAISPYTSWLLMVVKGSWFQGNHYVPLPTPNTCHHQLLLNQALSGCEIDVNANLLWCLPVAIKICPVEQKADDERKEMLSTER